MTTSRRLQCFLRMALAIMGMLPLVVACHGGTGVPKKSSDSVVSAAGITLREELQELDTDNDLVVTVADVGLHRQLVEGLRSGDNLTAYFAARIAGKSNCAIPSLLSALEEYRKNDRSEPYVFGPVEMARNGSPASEVIGAIRRLEAKGPCD